MHVIEEGAHGSAGYGNQAGIVPRLQHGAQHMQQLSLPGKPRQQQHCLAAHPLLMRCVHLHLQG